LHVLISASKSSLTWLQVLLRKSHCIDPLRLICQLLPDASSDWQGILLYAELCAADSTSLPDLCKQVNPIAWALYGIIVTQLGYTVDTRITVRPFVISQS
jgi:hypothetical protein